VTVDRTGATTVAGVTVPDSFEIARLDPAERAEAIATTARAFWPDPLFGFFCRDAVQEHRALPSFFRSLIDDATRHGEVWVARTPGRCVATASWVPPGGMPRDGRREARIYAGAIGTLVTGRNRRLALRLLSEVERHHPREPHWYLALVGVDPRWQGRGLGRAVIEPVLARCDADGHPAYLETQKPENLAFYARFAFTVRDEVRLPGAPPVWLLWREPQAS